MTNQPKHPRRPRSRWDLLAVLTLFALAYAFGVPVSHGYYFGGCDETAHTRHLITHVLGVAMCRDEAEEATTE